MSILINALSFIVAIGVLVTVHEFGHFWVARRLGVRVLRFSVGFGRPLLVYRDGRFSRVNKSTDTNEAPEQQLRDPSEKTEYVIAAIPLGGYVKMLDENEAEVPDQLKSMAFNRKPLWIKAAIVVAGPLFNLVFAVLAYWSIYMIGVDGLKPVLGPVTPSTLAAQAGFEEGDLILKVSDKDVHTWSGAAMEIIENALRHEHLTLQVLDQRERIQERAIDLTGFDGLYDGEHFMERVGFMPWQPTLQPIISKVVPGGAAARGGLRAGDIVLSANGEYVADWVSWVNIIRKQPGKDITVVVENEGTQRELMLRPSVVMTESGEIGQIGAHTEIPPDLFDDMRATERYGPLDAIKIATEKVSNMSVLMLDVLWKMVVGKAPLESISGPISIAQYAGQSAQIGLVPFLGFLAVISISLGVLNLLPIPMLDGGHLFYYAVEALKGSPLSESTHIAGQRIGIALLLMLMMLAFYNDIARLVG